MKFLVSKLGTLLLAVWLILYGLAALNVFTLPDFQMFLAILAVVAGIFILLEIRQQPTKNLGRLLLALFLIVVLGLFPLLNVSFAAKEMVAAIWAIVAGALLLLGR